jgi:hypothetical protein
MSRRRVSAVAIEEQAWVRGAFRREWVLRPTWPVDLPKSGETVVVLAWASLVSTVGLFSVWWGFMHGLDTNLWRESLRCAYFVVIIALLLAAVVRRTPEDLRGRSVPVTALTHVMLKRRAACAVVINIWAVSSLMLAIVLGRAGHGMPREAVFDIDGVSLYIAALSVVLAGALCIWKIAALHTACVVLKRRAASAECLRCGYEMGSENGEAQRRCIECGAIERGTEWFFES